MKKRRQKNLSKQTQIKTFIDFDKMKDIDQLPMETKLMSLEDRRKRIQYNN